MNDVLLPCDFRVETRGVDVLGKGTKLLTLGVRIIVEGACVEMFGQGGNTNKVCEGAGRG